MIDDINKLKIEFLKIKKAGLIKSLRKGSTGVGYTFENLLNKKEDQTSNPDFKNIELKCRLGYTKNDLTLFNLSPKKENGVACNYLFIKYSYHRYNNINDYKLFERKVFCKYRIVINNYSFRLYIDYKLKKLILKSYKNDVFLEDVCWWSFKELQERLEKKLTTLAIITAYPYRKSNICYYKYVHMNIFRLINFSAFLKLINSDKIFVSFYLKEEKSLSTGFDNHGVAFKIKINYIEKLFFELFSI